MDLENISAAALSLILVFGGPVGFLTKMLVTGKNPDQILQSSVCKILSHEELFHEDRMYEKSISNEAKKADYGKAAHEKVVHETAVQGKTIPGNKSIGSSERRVS